MRGNDEHGSPSTRSGIPKFRRKLGIPRAGLAGGGAQTKDDTLLPQEAGYIRTVETAEWPQDLPRPVRLLSPPQPVQALALLPDRPPAAFTWRHRRFVIRRADGPERIHGEWWRDAKETAATRDYWRVEDEQGRRFWLYRSGDGEDAGTGDLRWFLHGIF